MLCLSCFEPYSRWVPLSKVANKVTTKSIRKMNSKHAKESFL